MTQPVSPDAPWELYTLADPRTGQVRYVGVTSNFKRRIREHLTSKRERTRKANWIKSLKNLSLEPIHQTVESGVGLEARYEAERRLIAHLRSMGVNLTNATDGGDGSPGHIKSPELRAKLSAMYKGKKRPPEVGQKVSATKRANGQSEKQMEAFRRMAAMNIGRKRSPEVLRNMSTCRLGKSWGKHTAETKMAMSVSRKGKPKSPETRAKMVIAAKKREEAKRLAKSSEQPVINPQ